MRKMLGFELLTVLSVLSASALCPTTTASAAQFTGDANFLLGWKLLDRDDWRHVDDQREFGAETSWAATDWPIHIAGDMLVSADTDEIGRLDIVGSTVELAGGVRKIWSFRNFHPYAGGGLGIVSAYLKDERIAGDDDDRDATIGIWGGGGAFWRLGPRFNLGFATRFSRARVHLFGERREAGGFHAALILGFGWPPRK